MRMLTEQLIRHFVAVRLPPGHVAPSGRRTRIVPLGWIEEATGPPALAEVTAVADTTAAARRAAGAGEAVVEVVGPIAVGDRIDLWTGDRTAIRYPAG